MPKGRDILGTPPWKTKAATPAYRSGWDMVFDGERPEVSRPDGDGEQELPDQGQSGPDTPGEDGDLGDRELPDGDTFFWERSPSGAPGSCGGCYGRGCACGEGM